MKAEPEKSIEGAATYGDILLLVARAKKEKVKAVDLVARYYLISKQEAQERIDEACSHQNDR